MVLKFLNVLLNGKDLKAVESLSRDSTCMHIVSSALSVGSNYSKLNKDTL